VGDLENEGILHSAIKEHFLKVVFDEIDGGCFVEAAEGVVSVGNFGVEGFNGVWEDLHFGDEVSWRSEWACSFTRGLDVD